MKITADMVGKEIICGGTRREVLAVKGGDMWVENVATGFRETVYERDTWELAPEPPKKPSERIRELRSELAGDPFSINRADVRAEAVVRYLDELREQGKI